MLKFFGKVLALMMLESLTGIPLAKGYFIIVLIKLMFRGGRIN